MQLCFGCAKALSEDRLLHLDFLERWLGLRWLEVPCARFFSGISLILPSKAFEGAASPGTFASMESTVFNEAMNSDVHQAS